MFSWFSKPAPRHPPAELVQFTPSKTPQRVWSVNVGSADNYTFAPAYTFDAIYAAAADGTVVKVDPATGGEIWRKNVGMNLTAGVASDGHTVVVAGEKGNLIALDSDGNIVSLATDLKHSDHAVQDQVIKVDTDSGEVSLLVDFGDLFPDYKQSTDHSGIDESDPTATNRWDWIHFNTIQLMDDGSALLSARETSTMIKINDIEGTPSLDYMIGEPSVWNGMDAQPSFLTKVGDSGDTGGQHSITVQYDSSLEDGQYYIYMFDNDFGYAMTRPDFDWTMIDGISTAQSSKDENSNSQFRKYLVDENAGTYTEVQDFDVPYSPYVSSAQELSDDLNLVDIGMQGLFGVYDDDGNLKAQYKMVLSSGYIYRVYQYGFRGFYFA